MKRILEFTWLAIPVLAAAAAGTQVAGSPVGTWRGESKCTVQPSACHDEDALYRISAVGQAQDRVNVSANKMVEGQEVNMGSSECAYDSRAQSIDCPLPNGNSVHLEVNGSVIAGKMTLRDGTLWRKITLRKVEPQ